MEENKLEVIKSENFGDLKCNFYKNKQGEIFVTRTQIGQALGYSDPKVAIAKIHNRNKERMDKYSGVVKLVTPDGGTQETYVYNAKGIYEICRYSNQPKANDFYDWVYDVLENIRETGGYVNNEKLFVDTYLPFADEQTKMLFGSTLKTIRQQNLLISEMQPKVDYFDTLVERNLLTNLRDTAKELKVAPGKFNKFLLENKFLYRDSKSKLKPYQTKVEQGLFELKEFERNGHADNQTLVTPKGRETFRLLIEKIC